MDSNLQIPVTENQIKIANSGINLKPEQVAIIKNTVAKNTTDLELAYFLNVCHSVDLNPFLKEIWCYKDHRGNLLVFAGRDGFLTKAQRNPRYGGIRSCEIREKDEFSIDVANKEIHHKITSWGKERGLIKGSYAIVFIKDGEPTIELAAFETYNKSIVHLNKKNTWDTHPEEMIKKVAEAHALKKATGITCVQSEYEFDIKNGVAVPRGLNEPESLENEIKFLRENIESDVPNDVWIERVSILEIGKPNAETPGEKQHLRKVILEDKIFDLATGERIENEIT